MFAVVGATGLTGSSVVRGLVSRGVQVRAIVRDAAAARGVLPGAEVVQANLLEPSSIRAALDGVEAVYVGLGRAPNLVELEQHVVDAARAVGVAHYVKCSGVQVSLDGPSMIQMIHAQLEDYVRANVPHTIIAPSFFFQNFLGLAGAIGQGVLPLPTGAARAGLIDADDIARSVIAVMGQERHLGARYAVTGPESLSHADAAAIFSRVLGRPVVHVDLPEADFIAACIGAGMPDWFAPVLADVYVRFFGSGAADLVTTSVAELTGTAPRSLAGWVADNARAFGG